MFGIRKENELYNEYFLILHFFRHEIILAWDFEYRTSLSKIMSLLFLGGPCGKLGASDTSGTAVQSS